MALSLLIAIVVLFYIVPGSVLLRPEYVLLLGGAVAGPFLSGGSMVLRLLRKEMLMILCLFFLAAISLIFQRAEGAQEASSRDAMIFLRYLIYVASLIVGGMLGLRLRDSLSRVRILFTLVAIATATITISFSQYFDLASVNSFLIPIYGDEQRHSALAMGLTGRRVIGTQGNPNYWGFYISVFAVACFYWIVVKRKIYASPLGLLLLCSIIMTGSRTALIALAAAAAACLVVPHGPADFTRGNSLQRLSMLAISGLLVAACVLGVEAFLEGYYEKAERFSVANTTTLEYRFQYWSEFLNPAVSDPLLFMFGRGPAKSADITMGDNMYVLLLRDFGVTALFVYIWLQYSQFRRLWNYASVLPKSRAAAPSIGALIVISFAVLNLTADGWFSVRIIIPLLFAYGYVVMACELDVVKLRQKTALQCRETRSSKCQPGYVRR